MPFLRKPVLKPIVGIDYMNPSTYINDRGGYPKNMRLYRDELMKRDGKSLYGSDQIASGNPIIHLVQYPLESLSIRMLRFSKAGCEKYNTTTGVWDNITGAAFTGTNTDFFDTCIGENKVIITNRVDAMRTYNDAGNTADLVAADGTVPKAATVEYNESGYLIAGNYIDGGNSYPFNVKWTDIGDITKWGSGNYGSAALRHSPNPIHKLKNLNEYTVVYKKDAIYLGRPVDTSDIIKWDVEWTGIGILNSRVLQEHKGIHYFMGTDDFYSYKGVRPESLADKTVQRHIFERLNSDKQERCFSLLVSKYDEIWFFVVTSGNDWPTEIWKYNYRNGFWYFDTCTQMASAATYYAQSSTSWNSLSGTWNNKTGRWDDFDQTNTPINLLGSYDGYTYKIDAATTNDNGVAVDASWESMDFAADKFEIYKRWLQLDFMAKGSGTLKVEYSTDYGSTWSTITTHTLTGDWGVKPTTVYFDVVAAHIRFRFSNSNSNERFYFRQFYPYYLHREETSR